MRHLGRQIEQPPAVSLNDGSKAVLMGLAAHRSIDTGQPVLWADMIAEFEREKVAAVASLAQAESAAA